MLTDEEMWYADEYYKDWLISSYSYHFENGEDVCMSDPFWDGLARLYVKALGRYQFLKEIGFDGSTMGVGVDGEALRKECENPRINRLIFE